MRIMQCERWILQLNPFATSSSFLIFLEQKTQTHGLEEQKPEILSKNFKVSSHFRIFNMLCIREMTILFI